MLLSQQMSPGTFALLSLAVILSASIIAGLILTFVSRDAAGSGIPQAKVAFWRDFGFMPARVVIAKFFAGAISIGGGDGRPTRWIDRPMRNPEQSIAQGCGRAGAGDAGALNNKGSGRQNGGKLFETTSSCLYDRKYADWNRHSSRCPSIAKPAFGRRLGLVGRSFGPCDYPPSKLLEW
jgi:hypothetical protein